jgi:hypothetical protein
LSLGLGENKGLTRLELGGNALGPAGAKSLAGGLRGHPGLRSLDLGYNPLGPEGAQAVADVVKFELKVCVRGGLLAGYLLRLPVTPPCIHAPCTAVHPSIHPSSIE